MKSKLVLIIGTAVALTGPLQSMLQIQTASTKVEPPLEAEVNTASSSENGMPGEDAASVLRKRDTNAGFEHQLLERLQTDPSEDRDVALAALFRDWVEHDAAAAAECVRGLEPEGLRLQCMREVLWLWTDRDASEAIAWADQLHTGRELALTQIYSRVAERDPVSALALLNRDNAPPAGTLASVTLQWAETDFAAAADWVHRQPAGGERDQLLSRIALVQSRTNPREAASLVVEQISPGDHQMEAAISVLHQWALRDPEGAAQWVAAFGESPLRERALAELEGIARYRPGNAN